MSTLGDAMVIYSDIAIETIDEFHDWQTPQSYMVYAKDASQDQAVADRATVATSHFALLRTLRSPPFL